MGKPFYVRARAFGKIRSVLVKVDQGLVWVWDYRPQGSGEFTLGHSLSKSAAARIRRLAASGKCSLAITGRQEKMLICQHASHRRSVCMALLSGGWSRAMNATKLEWVTCRDRLPPVGVVVMTKIDNADGCRNEQALKRYQRSPETRSLWFFPDGSMHVYYEPTHWAEV